MSELLECINCIHTTTLGIERIKKNLSIDEENIVEWCKHKIMNPSCKIERRGKNFYATLENIIFCINAHSYTIITAHKYKK